MTTLVKSTLPLSQYRRRGCALPVRFASSSTAVSQSACPTYPHRASSTNTRLLAGGAFFMRVIDKVTEEEFWDHVHIGKGGCWKWTGSVNATGYGYFLLVDELIGKSRMWLAHRYVYTNQEGPIKAGHQLHHVCYERRCVNPAHLRPMPAKAHLILHGRLKREIYPDFETKQIYEVGDRYLAGEDPKALAEEYPILKDAVLSIGYVQIRSQAIASKGYEWCDDPNDREDPNDLGIWIEPRQTAKKGRRK